MAAARSSRSVTALSVGLLALTGARPAVACDCAQQSFAVPALGATNVPVSVTQVFVPTDVLGGEDLVLVELATEQTIGLTAAPEAYRAHGRRFDVAGALAPSTSYALRGATDDVAFFTTGTVADTTAPPVPTVEGFAVEALSPSSCGEDLVAIRGTVTAPDADVVVVELTGGGATQRFYVPPEDALQRIGSACGLAIEIDTSGDVQARVWSEDVSGNRSDEMTMTTEGTSGGGCATGGASAGGLVGLLALVRRRRSRR